jgi:hypothetical protein
LLSTPFIHAEEWQMVASGQRFKRLAGTGGLTPPFREENPHVDAPSLGCLNDDFNWIGRACFR